MSVEKETQNGAQVPTSEETKEVEFVQTTKKAVAVQIFDAYLDDDEEDDMELRTGPSSKEMLIAQDSELDLEDHTHYELEQLNKNEQSTAKTMLQFWKPKLVTSAQLVSRGLALLDMSTDINLLYKSSISNNSVLTVCLFLSIIAPYLLQYSCGIKLFTLNRTFDRLKGLKKILVVLFLMPCGVLFFIFLDVFDVFFNFYLIFQLFFCCASITDIQRVEEDIAGQLGMDRMNWEGIKRQKKVSQLMFETIPQVTLQILMFSDRIPGLALTKGITSTDILVSAFSAITNAIVEVIKLYIESKAVEEGFFNYALTCFMARVGWVPFRSSIRRFLENPSAKLCYISYNIRYMFVSVDFFFSTLTIQQLIETLLIRPIKKDGHDGIIIIDFHESLRLLGVHSLVELMRTCAERNIFIKGVNDTDKLSWSDAVLQSMDNGSDVRIISNSRDAQGCSHIMSIYKSEKSLHSAWKSKQKRLKQLMREHNPQSKDSDFLSIAFLPTVFSQCIPLDFDINISSLRAGETLVFELIRHNDYTNLFYLLNEYQTETNCDVYLDIRNKKGKSPLYYALRQYIRPKKHDTLRQKSQSPPNASMMLKSITNDDAMTNIELSLGNIDIDSKMYMLLLKNNADPNFPVLKRGGLTQSCIGYLLEEEQLQMMLEVIPFGAELNSKEIVQLSHLFLPKDISESIEEWKMRVTLLMKICNKLKLPLDYIRDANQCNPMHLLLRNETFYDHPQLSLIIKELQITSLIWMFQKDEFGNLPVVGILREHNPNINVFKMVYDSAPTDYHRQRLVAILQGNRYTMGILIYFIVGECRKLVQFISCEENKIIRNELSTIVAIFGRDIRWVAKDHSRINVEDNTMETKVDLSIATVLNDGGLYLEDYMRYQIATKLRNEFNLKMTKIEEVMIQKWNRKAQAKSMFKVETTMKLQGLLADEAGDLSTEIRTWIGHIDQQITKQITQRQQIKKRDTNIMGLHMADIKEEKSGNAEQDDEYNANSIVSLGDTTRLKTKKHVEETGFKAVFWKRVELFYAFVVEGLSVMDLFSDVVILMQLLKTPNQWWTAFMILFLLSPYLVSFCALASIFQSHEVIDGRPQLNTFVIGIFLSPLSILFLMLLDIVFMLYIIIALILTLPLMMCCCGCNVSCVDSDWIFKLFGMTHMETKGYRRLRTLSQLLFETFPQILLQVRMLYALQIEGLSDDLSVSESAVLFSVMIASIHFVLEVVTISAEASATKVTLFQYGINCLNARLNWVPLSHLLVRHHRDYQQQQRQKALKKKNRNKRKKKMMSDEDYNVLNFENLTHRVCSVTYVVNFEFSSSAIRRLAGYVTRMQKYVDVSSDDVKQIASLLPIKHCTIPRVILGEKSCLNLTLSDLSVLYRNAAHRLLIDGGSTLDWYYFVRRHFRNSSANNAQEEPQFDVKKAQFLLYDFLMHGELKAVHYIYQEIEDWGPETAQLVPVQGLKRNLLLSQAGGGILKDVATLRRFWKSKYMFGLSCKESHQIYDVLLRYYSKALSLYQSMNVKQRQRLEAGATATQDDAILAAQENTTLADQYQGILNMIILILWYTQSAIIGHKCPQCNIGWREYIDKRIRSNNRINIMKQLPEMVKIFVKKIEVERTGLFKQNKNVETTIKPRTIIPFILCECSDRFARKIDEKILKDATSIGDKVFDFEEYEEGDDEDIERFTWSWLDIEGKDSTGTYVEYDKEVNDEINERLEIALSNKPLQMQKSKTLEEQNLLKVKDFEKAIYIKLMKGKFGTEEVAFMSGAYYLKVDRSVTPWRYTEVYINQYGLEVASKTKIIRRITEENSINMVLLESSKSVSDKIIANLDQKNIDMLSTVIESKHDATSSYTIMKNLYKQGMLTDLLSTAVSLKLRHGYDQFLVAISRFFRKKTIEESEGHTGFAQKVDKIVYTFPYRDIEDGSGLTVLGCESVNIVIRIKMDRYDIDDEFPGFKDYNSMIEAQDTHQLPGSPVPGSGGAIHLRERIQINLWMKIPNFDSEMLHDFNNVLITKQDIYKGDLNKPIKFNCNLQQYYALGYFNPSLTAANVDKRIEFYIEASQVLNIETIQTKVKMIVNQTISESKFERVNNKFVKEHNVSAWQYFVDGKWSSYEQITCIQIEEDLKKLLKQRKQNEENPEKTIIIPLCSGSFFSKSQNKNTYQIRIVLAQYPPRIYQLNVKTGHTRHVMQDPPFWLQLEDLSEQSIYQNPYQIKWKYQCEISSISQSGVYQEDEDEDEKEKKKKKFIYVDITTDVEYKEGELTLQEKIENAYQQRLKRYQFNDGLIIHFNYHSIPHTFVETNNDDDEIRKVIRLEPYSLRKKGVAQDLIMKNGPFWELMKPVNKQQYNQFMIDLNEQQKDETDIDDFFDSFIEDRDKDKRREVIRCSLCECNLESWEVLDDQFTGNKVQRMKTIYSNAVNDASVTKHYDKFCEYIQNNSIVLIGSDAYYHAGCITEHFDNQFNQDEDDEKKEEKVILKCAKTDSIIYDSEKLDTHQLIGAPMKGKYGMIVNKNEKLQQTQILFVFDELVSPITHVIKTEDAQLLQNYRDAFRRRLIRLQRNENDNDEKSIVYIGNDVRLKNIFKKTLKPERKQSNSATHKKRKASISDVANEVAEDDAAADEIDEDVLHGIVSDVLLQKTVTYDAYDDEDEDDDDDVAIAAMVENEMHLADEDKLVELDEDEIEAALDAMSGTENSAENEEAVTEDKKEDLDTVIEVNDESANDQKEDKVEDENQTETIKDTVLEVKDNSVDSQQNAENEELIET